MPHPYGQSVILSVHIREVSGSVMKHTLRSVTSFEQAIRQTTIRGDYRDNSLTWSFASESFGKLTGLSDKWSVCDFPSWHQGFNSYITSFARGFFPDGTFIDTYCNMSNYSVLRLSFPQ